MLNVNPEVFCFTHDVGLDCVSQVSEFYTKVGQKYKICTLYFNPFEWKSNTTQTHKSHWITQVLKSYSGEISHGAAQIFQNCPRPPPLPPFCQVHSSLGDFLGFFLTDTGLFITTQNNTVCPSHSSSNRQDDATWDRLVQVTRPQTGIGIITYVLQGNPLPEVRQMVSQQKWNNGWSHKYVLDQTAENKKKLFKNK